MRNDSCVSPVDLDQSPLDSDTQPSLYMNGVRLDDRFRARLESSRALALSLTVKRAIDIIAGSLLLVMSSPIILLAGVLVALTSKGGMLHLGMRGGKAGKQFTCLKLRTMCVNQREILMAKGLCNIGERGTLLIFSSDPRITTIGRWLRKLSIDELPQLWNVVKGDMSLIGPRALVVTMLEEFPNVTAVRSVLRPGITGLWQVRRRTKNAAVADMIEDDMEYIERFTLFLDLKIALLTIPKIIEPRIPTATSQAPGK